MEREKQKQNDEKENKNGKQKKREGKLKRTYRVAQVERSVSGVNKQ